MKQNTNEVDTSVVLTEIKTKDAEKKKLRIIKVIIFTLVLIATFVINDPVTTPVTRANKIVYSLLLALLTFISRLIFNNLLSIYICIITLNLISFVLNKTTITLKSNLFQKIISCLLLISLIITPIIYLGSNNLLFFQVK